jgi:outer membrane protein assembly factor BamE (lipoprotein component of BamABCDE complex)
MTIVRKKHAIILGLMFVAFTLAAVSCATVGRKFPVDAVSKIKIGETTKEEITSLFGSPWRTGIDDGKKTWTYVHYRYSAFGDSKTRDLVLRFDEHGVVTSYTFNSTYPEDENL